MKQQRSQRFQKKSTFNKTKVFYTYLVIILFAFGLFFFYQQVQTKRSIAKLFKSYQLSKQDVNYKNISHPFFGKGLIFYNVTFPNLALDHSIEKVIVKQQSDFLHVRFFNVHIHVLNSLAKNYNINILQSLSEYKPIADSFQKPLQSLALSNIDEVKFDVSLIIKPKKDNLIVYGQILNPDLIDVDFKVSVQPFSNKNVGLFYAFYANVTPISVTLKDRGLFKKYDAYLASLNIESNTPQRNILKKNTLRFLNGDLKPLNFKSAYRKIK